MGSDKSESQKKKPQRKPTKADPQEEREANGNIAALLQGAPDLDALLPSQKLYYRIGEVSKVTDIKPYVLRYWESEFRWMAPQKSRSKQRLYRRKDIEVILLIKQLLYEERYTIAGARQRLKELGVAGAKEEAAVRTRRVAATGFEASGKTREAIASIRAELVSLRAELAGS